MTESTSSVLFALAALGLLVYAALGLVRGLINGEKRIAMRFRPAFTVNRWLNPGAFWFYTGADILSCALFAAFAYHFISGLIP
jgi:hypothetical protein